jgi:predicted nuclease of restriction endonuclease-like (RecB) superfamily
VGHLVVLMNAVKSGIERDWYALQTIQNGWSRNVLAHQIQGGLFNR